MPAAGHAEKDGTFTNTQRLLQWREKAVDPPGDSRSENLVHLSPRRPARRKGRGRSASAQRTACSRSPWDYPVEGNRTTSPVAEEILQEINGWTIADQQAASRFRRAQGRRLHRLRLLDLFRCLSQGRREPRQRTSLAKTSTVTAGAGPGRRTGGLSTTAPPRAPTAQPWSERKKLVWWDEAAKKWTGNDVPDFVATKPPDYQPRRRRRRRRRAGRRQALHPPRRWLRLDLGPRRPERRSAPRALRVARISRPQSHVPAATIESRRTDPSARRERIRALSRRALSVRSHHLPAHRASHRRRYVAHPVASGGTPARTFLRNLSWSWPKQLSITHGDWVTIVTARGAIEAHALVTSRMQTAHHRRQARPSSRRPLSLGLQWHWSKATSPTIWSPSPKSPTCASWKPKACSAICSPETAASNAARVSSASNSMQLHPRRNSPHAPVKTGFPHRRHALHRLQSLRSRLQGMERSPRRRHDLDRPFLRQHQESRRVHLAPRDVPRTARRRRAPARAT